MSRLGWIFRNGKTTQRERPVGMVVDVDVVAVDVVGQGVEGDCCFECRSGNERMAGAVAPGDHDGDGGACDPRVYQHRERHHSMRAHSPGRHSRPSRDQVRVYGNRRRRQLLHYQALGGRRYWGFRVLRHASGGTLQQVFRRAFLWMPGRPRGETDCVGHEV